MHWWHWWLPLQHWLAIHTGADNEPGSFYGFWSGFGSDLGEVVLIGALAGLFRRYNCEVKGCWRLRRHVTDGGHHVCRRHHPDGAPTHQDVIDAHHAARERRHEHEHNGG